MINESFFMGALIIAILVIAGLITLYVFYLINLMNLLKEIDPSNRQMPPSNVFLMFIPLFNLVYPFIMYPKISESIRLECEARNMPVKGDALKGLGLAFAITSLVQVIFNQLKTEQMFQMLSSIFSLGVLVIWIIYWVQSADIKKKFKQNPKSGFGLNAHADLLD